jgi:hypothetical protein
VSFSQALCLFVKYLQKMGAPIRDWIKSFEDDDESKAVFITGTLDPPYIYSVIIQL